MFGTVTSWFGVTKPDAHSPSQSPTRERRRKMAEMETTNDTVVNSGESDQVPTDTNVTPSAEQKDANDEVKNKTENSQEEPAEAVVKSDFADLTPEQIQKQLDEVSQKAIQSAKEWGTYLYSFGKAATEQVAKASEQVAKVSVQAAKTLKDTVEDKTIIGEFSKEQNKYIDEKREKSRHSEAAVPPWVGYNEEEAMKSQIMALSSDKRNFLRNPPAGVSFSFDFETIYPVAMATLQEDSNLRKMRFDLVPKQVKEEQFWRNYFYRVSLIKQSTQLTSLAHQSGATGETGKSSESSRRSSVDGSQKDDSSDYDKLSDEIEVAGMRNQDKDAAAASSPSKRVSESENMADEFVSDTFQDSRISEEELKKEMEQLGMDNKEKKGTDDENIPDWEKELQAELQEYEVVDDGNDENDADIEKEILMQIEAEAKES